MINGIFWIGNLIKFHMNRLFNKLVSSIKHLEGHSNKWIAQEYTFVFFFLKLWEPILLNKNKENTTKHMKVRDVRFSTFNQLVRRFANYFHNYWTILGITGSINSFSPKWKRETNIHDHCSSSFYESTISTFSKSVLLRSSNN